MVYVRVKNGQAEAAYRITRIMPSEIRYNFRTSSIPRAIDYRYNLVMASNTDPSALRSVVVYCGSSLGNKEAFVHAAQENGAQFCRKSTRVTTSSIRKKHKLLIVPGLLTNLELGKLLLKRSISLIYGGGSMGIMGVIAKTVHEGGGKVEGILPKFFLDVHPKSSFIGHTVIVDDMHTRKRMFCEKADAFIALPGGIGTLEEIVEMICWARLKLHRKPVGIVNTLNYYGGLLDWYQNALKVGFLDPADENLFEVSDNCEQLLDCLESRLSMGTL